MVYEKDGFVNTGNVIVQSSNFKIAGNINVDEEDFDVPLQVVSCEYVQDPLNTSMKSVKGKGYQYTCTGAWKVSIKNHTNYSLPVYISADYQSFVNTDVKVNSSEHIQSALYNFHNGLNTTFSCKANTTTDFYFKCDGMPYPEGDKYFLNVWNGFGMLSDGKLEDFQGGSTGGSSGGVSGKFGTGDIREIEDYGYKCFYSTSVTIPEDEKWETNPLNDDNKDDFGFDDNGPLGGGGDMLLSEKIASKFPFCLPFDIYKSFQLLLSEPQAPLFKVDYSIKLNKAIGGGSIPIIFNIDFKPFEKLAVFSRWFSSLSFGVGLVLLTPKIVKGAH